MGMTGEDGGDRGAGRVGGSREDFEVFGDPAGGGVAVEFDGDAFVAVDEDGFDQEMSMGCRNILRRNF